MDMQSDLRRREGQTTDTRRNRRVLTRWGILIAAVLLAAIAVPLACLRPVKQEAFTGATIALRMDLESGQYAARAEPVAVLTVSDPNRLAELLEFFPQLGRDSHRAAGWKSGATIELSKLDGGKVTIDLSGNDALEVWSAGKGDWPVKGDLKAFLRAVQKEQSAGSRPARPTRKEE